MRAALRAAVLTASLLLAVLQAAAVAASLETIQQRRYLIVGVKDNLYPLGFRDERGELAGFEIDLARTLAEALFADRTAIQLVPVRNRDRLEALEKQHVDLVIANLSIGVPRARAVDFSFPYLTVNQAVLLKRESTLRTLSDLQRVRLAVLSGSSNERAIRAFLPGAGLVPVASYQEGVQALETGRADGFAADGTVLGGWVQDRPAYRLLSSELDTSGLAVAMPRGLQNDSLRRWVNGQIERLLKQGWLAERARIWGLKGRS